LDVLQALVPVGEVAAEGFVLGYVADRLLVALERRIREGGA
jgi:hypothetical protein